MKPQISVTEIREILAANKVTDKVCIIGIRGYYLDSMGKRGENDRNVYDDCIIVISPRRFEAFQANTDPSIYKKGVATMVVGVHRYCKGKHKGRYWALRLVGERVAVTRDRQGASIGVALNIHKGGRRTTGSLGCQTIQPDDWDDFIESVYDEMDFYGQKTIPYVLIDERERRAGKFKMTHLDLNLNEQEIDSLLEKIEPAAQQVGSPSENPSEFSALITPTTDAASQPQASENLPEQPVQNDCPVGTRPTDDPVQISQGGFLSRILTGIGGIGGLLAAVKGFASDNLILISVGAVCVTLLILVLIFRTIILDFLRMQIAADPAKYNVK